MRKEKQSSVLKYLNNLIIIISTFSLNLFLSAIRGNSSLNRSRNSGAHYLEQKILLKAT